VIIVLLRFGIFLLIVLLRFGIFVIIFLLRFGIFVIIVKLEFREHRLFVIEWVLVGNVLSPKFSLRGSSGCNIRVVNGGIMEQVDKSVIGQIECRLGCFILGWKWFGYGLRRSIVQWKWLRGSIVQWKWLRRSIVQWKWLGVDERCKSVSDLWVSRGM
jgi:hypothetical protein